MNRRDFLRSALYGGVAALAPLPAFGGPGKTYAEKVMEDEPAMFWRLAEDDGWRHVVVICRSATDRTVYVNGKVDEDVPETPLRTSMEGGYPHKVEYFESGAGELSFVSIYDHADKQLMTWRPHG